VVTMPGSPFFLRSRKHIEQDLWGRVELTEWITGFFEGVEGVPGTGNTVCFFNPLIRQRNIIFVVLLG